VIHAERWLEKNRRLFQAGKRVRDADDCEEDDEDEDDDEDDDGAAGQRRARKRRKLAK
jgi:hypothetical protein